MPVITIREGQIIETGSKSSFTATLSFDGRVNFQVEVQSPFGLAEEASLEWYFEDWLRFPMLDTVRANAAAASVRAYRNSRKTQRF